MKTTITTMKNKKVTEYVLADQCKGEVPLVLIPVVVSAKNHIEQAYDAVESMGMAPQMSFSLIELIDLRNQIDNLIRKAS
jgi:hypothetical protein